MIIKIILLLLLNYFLLINCIDNCNDDRNQCQQCTKTTIICTDKNLINVPMVSPFTLYLNFSHNKIYELKQKHFVHLPLLEILDLSFNQIQIINDRVFAGLGNLKKLFLNNNQIKLIEPYGFRNLHELQLLSIHSNPIININNSINIFNELFKLKYLSINSPLSNDIKQICDINQMNYKFCMMSETTQFIQPSIQPPIPPSIQIDQKILNKHKSNVTLPIQPTNSTFIYRESKNSNKNIAEIIKHGTTPILTNVPESIYRVKLGDTLLLSCDANGEPKPSIKWLRFGRTISFNSTLSLNDIQPDDDGIYECFARNRNGKAAKEIRIIIMGSISSASDLNEHRKLLDEIIDASRYSKQIDLGDLITINTTDVLKFFDLTRLLMVYSDNHTEFIATELPKSLHNLTATQATIMGNFTGCVGGARFESYDCHYETEFSDYYSITGICNNRLNPDWGASISPFLRLLPANYDDGLAKPIGWFDNNDKNLKRPNVRKVTMELLSTNRITMDEQYNHLLMQFGQFLDHDLTFAALSDNRNLFESDIIDCERICNENVNVEPCYSIRRSQNDNDNCIEFKRSAEYCGTGYTSTIFGQLIKREQVNLITSFIDGSQIYGNTLDVWTHIRHPLLSENYLLNSTIIANNSHYLPYNNNRLIFAMDCQPEPESYQECFLAGDHRANEQLGLLVFHNLWLRNHNSLAKRFKSIRPEWSNDKIFYETRKIITAQLQIITYRDWLPSIVGAKGMKMLGTYKGYNETINPSISNVFATVAMRFGHTLVNKNLIKKLSSSNKQKNNDNDDDTMVHRTFFKTNSLLQSNVFDSVLLGLAMIPLKKSMPEQAITDELTEKLFKLSRTTPLDLASINIQRGRDHGIPSYNEWRKFCGLTEAKNFNDLKYEIKNVEIRQKLQKLYQHPDYIDLYVAGIMENTDHDSKIGPTFRCLIVDQFKRLRDGDRFFYLNKGNFNNKQLKQLEKTTLTMIICQNSDNIQQFPKYSFKLLNNDNGWINCNDEINEIDLSIW